MSPNTSPVLETSRGVLRHGSSINPVVNFNGNLPEWADYVIYVIHVLIAKFVMLNIKLPSMDPSPACRKDRTDAASRHGMSASKETPHDLDQTNLIKMKNRV